MLVPALSSAIDNEPTTYLLGKHFKEAYSVFWMPSISPPSSAIRRLSLTKVAKSKADSELPSSLPCWVALLIRKAPRREAVTISG